MKQEVIDELVEVGVFNRNAIEEDEYTKHSSTEGNLLYHTTDFEWGKYFWKTDTKGLTHEEIDLLLKIDQTKNIRTIKNVAIFFAVLTAISLAISIIGATSIASLF